MFTKKKEQCRPIPQYEIGQKVYVTHCFSHGPQEGVVKSRKLDQTKEGEMSWKYIVLCEVDEYVNKQSRGRHDFWNERTGKKINQYAECTEIDLYTRS